MESGGEDDGDGSPYRELMEQPVQGMLRRVEEITTSKSAPPDGGPSPAASLRKPTLFDAFSPRASEDRPPSPPNPVTAALKELRDTLDRSSIHHGTGSTLSELGSPIPSLTSSCADMLATLTGELPASPDKVLRSQVKAPDANNEGAAPAPADEPVRKVLPLAASPVNSADGSAAENECDLPKTRRDENVPPKAPGSAFKPPLPAGPPPKRGAKATTVIRQQESAEEADAPNTPAPATPTPVAGVGRAHEASPEADSLEVDAVADSFDSSFDGNDEDEPEPSSSPVEPLSPQPNKKRNRTRRALIAIKNQSRSRAASRRESLELAKAADVVSAEGTVNDASGPAAAEDAAEPTPAEDSRLVDKYRDAIAAMEASVEHACKLLVELRSAGKLDTAAMETERWASQRVAASVDKLRTVAGADEPSPAPPPSASAAPPGLEAIMERCLQQYSEKLIGAVASSISVAPGMLPTHRP